MLAIGKSTSAASLLLLMGCADPRPIADDPRACVNWQNDIQPLVKARCEGCHSGDAPAGRYNLSSYLGTLGRGGDATPNAVAGDPTSRLLTTLDPATVNDAHKNLQDAAPQLRQWVVDCRLAYFRSPLHGSGILNPADGEFHGALVASRSWDFSLCARCHGADFAGGPAKVSCLTCHANGPTACDTCHGQPPPSGAHVTHVAGGALGKRFDCGECHVKPKAYDDAGHLLAAGGAPDSSPAEVTFANLAVLTPKPAERSGPPIWDPATKSCRNVYCHGDAFADGAAAHTEPRWLDGAGEAPCGACHGLPPANHASDRCATCHSLVVDEARHIIDPALHINGRVEVGSGSGGCSSCHGSTDSPAPPPDTTGSTATSSIGVGAHAGHLKAQLGLRGPLACDECHLVPRDPFDPGHMDSALPAEVFPPSATFLGTAYADGATPAWSHQKASCAGVYCHGGGVRLAADQASGLKHEPVWTAGSGEAACGSCHGLPPEVDIAPGIQHPNVGIDRCYQCHPNTVDSAGKIILTGPPSAETSRHINGVVDAP